MHPRYARATAAVVTYTPTGLTLLTVATLYGEAVAKLSVPPGALLLRAGGGAPPSSLPLWVRPVGGQHGHGGCAPRWTLPDGRS